MAEPTIDDEYVAQALLIGAALLEVIDEQMPLLTSTDDFFTRQWGAAALARCRVTLEGVLTLHASRPDVIGWLNRNLLESFAVGMLCTFEDEDFVDRLKTSFAENLGKVQRANGMPAQLPKPDQSASKFNVETGLKRVGELLIEAGRPSNSMSKMYDIVYRNESTFGGHGLGIAAKYLSVDGNVNVINPRPGSLNTPHPVFDVIIAITLTAWLAEEVNRRFGISLDKICLISDRLNEIDTVLSADLHTQKQSPNIH